MSERDLVFISYAHEDLDQVRKVYEGLKKRKVNVWFDKEKKKPGKWKVRIEKAISKSRYFIFFLSEASLKKTEDENRGFVEEELQIAWEFARDLDEKVFTIIPVRLEDCECDDNRLLGWEQYDLFKDFEMALDKLAIDLGGSSLSDASAKDERTEDKKLIESMLGKGDTLVYSGEYERSLSILKDVINIKPDYKVWNNIGVILINLGRHKEANEAFDRAKEINPDSWAVWFQKGKSLAGLGSHLKAIEAYKKAKEINPDPWAVWFQKGKSLACLGRQDEAIEAFDKAKEINPDSWAVWFQMGKSLACLGRHDEANEAFDKAKEIKPDAWAVWFHKGESLACLGRHDEANEAFMKAKDAFTKSEGDKG